MPTQVPFGATARSDDSVIGREVLLHILRVALLAPSNSNCQPWRLRVERSSFEVHLDAARAQALLDVDRVASTLSLGAFLETARLEAKRRGIAISTTLHPRPGAWARCETAQCPAETEELHSEIPRRHANRLAYDASSLSPDEARLLCAEGGPARLALALDRDQLSRLARLGGEAERIRTQNRACHRDHYRWLRWSHADSVTTRDGLDVRTMGLCPYEPKLMRAFESWDLARLAIPVASRANGAVARRLLESSSAIGVLTVPTLSATALVAAGASLQRVWLRATQLGLAFCPLVALPLLALEAKLHGSSELSPTAVSDLRTLASRLEEEFPAHPGIPVFMFRMGRAPMPSIRSLRRSLEEVLLADSESSSVPP